MRKLVLKLSVILACGSVSMDFSISLPASAFVQVNTWMLLNYLNECRMLEYHRQRYSDEMPSDALIRS